MDIQTESNNKRLLEALDHVDIKYVAELVDGLRLPKPEDGRKGIRTFRHAKQLALIAACALLLGAAIPTVQYVLPMVNAVLGGNAGAGTEELDSLYDTQTIDLEFEKALESFSNMSGEEIYAEVLKGGWIVQDVDISSMFDAGEDIWQEFLISVENTKPITVLFADFSEDIDAYTRLSKICYDGKVFTITQQIRDHGSVLKTETKEFKYFLRSRWPCYFFSNNLDSDPANCISSDSKYVGDMEPHFVVIWSE